MDIKVVIPARIASTRLPRKPLIMINGKSIIHRTYLQCAKVIAPEKIFVLTDSSEIFEHCKALDIQVVMTSDTCLTGTDRIAEFAKINQADYYVNVQGDEPIINPLDISKMINETQLNPGKILNGFAAITEEFEYRSRSIPKVVMREDGRLLYISRSEIPGSKSDVFQKSWKQVCIYAYPAAALFAFSDQHSKTVLEDIEDIEIVRFLELGFDVQMVELKGDSIAVDTQFDLDRVIQRIVEVENEE